MTLDEARAWLRERVNDGATCPCCRQFAKKYRRKLGGSMCRALIVFLRADLARPGAWHRPQDALDSHVVGLGGDYMKLACWGLLEQHPETAGRVRITPKGIDFARRRITVPSHVEIYDGRVLRLNGSQIDIVAALGKRFDYAELMRDTPRGGDLVV